GLLRGTGRGVGPGVQRLRIPDVAEADGVAVPRPEIAPADTDFARTDDPDVHSAPSFAVSRKRPGAGFKRRLATTSLTRIAYAFCSWKCRWMMSAIFSSVSSLRLASDACMCSFACSPTRCIT